MNSPEFHSAPSRLVSVVVPVFRNRETLRATFEGVLRTRDEAFPSCGLEVVFVDDGSDDGSWGEICSLQQAYPAHVRGLKLSRNFGQLSAILAGYEAARGDAIVTLSADLQDPPSVIAHMVKHWESGCEVVIAHRESREDDLRATLFSRIAYGAARSANPRMPQGGFDFLLLSRRATQILLSFRGRHRFFQGDVLWIGLPTAFVPYARQKRPVGRSGWTFARKFKYFTDLILDSSYLPIRLMSAAGIVTALLGLAYALVIVWAWFIHRTPFEGWAPLMVSQLVIGGLIMAMLGIIGEYLWRIYDDVKTRPMYVVQESIAPEPHAAPTE
jgi:polyisoprenyl-phosphate glycosyltransferase